MLMYIINVIVILGIIVVLNNVSVVPKFSLSLINPLNSMLIVFRHDEPVLFGHAQFNRLMCNFSSSAASAFVIWYV
jgi:hypothetical protein